MTEAEEVFANQMTRWRQESWMTLKEHLKDPVAYELEGESGTTINSSSWSSGTVREAAI